MNKKYNMGKGKKYDCILDPCNKSQFMSCIAFLEWAIVLANK
jgi:NADPH:quinone reductase-like Zn-dependent oxidoreductase